MFDAKRLYRERLQVYNQQKNRKKLDFRQANQEIYSPRRDEASPPKESETYDERDEW